MSIEYSNYPFTVALSHDVDRIAKRWQFFFYILHTIQSLQPKQLKEQFQSLRALKNGDDPYWNFSRIMQLETELGIRSTFFFLNESGQASLLNPRSFVLFWGRYKIDDPKIQSTIKELDAGGWEIGLHGSYFSYCHVELLKREKDKLEQILGHRVLGSRQHYLNLKIPETWHYHAQIGIQYDSTLGYSKRIGLRWGSCRPFYPYDPLTGKQIPVLQIPVGIMDGPLMQHPQPWSIAKEMIDRVEEVQGVLTLDWHQRVFNEWEYEHYRDMYVKIIEECQRRGARITTLGTVYETWMANNPE